MSLIFAITAYPSFHWVQQNTLQQQPHWGRTWSHSKLHIFDYRYSIPFICTLLLLSQTLHSLESPVRHVAFVNYHAHCGVPSSE